MPIRRVAVSVTLFVGAFAVAFVVAGGLAPDSTASEVSTTTTSVSSPVDPAEPVEPFYVDPHETLIGSTVLVPVQLDLRDDSVNLDFDVVSLAPGGETAVRDDVVATSGEGGFERDIEPLLLIDWLLTTNDGEQITATITNPEVTVVRFPTDERLEADDIQSIEVTRYLVATPVDVAFTISPAEPDVVVFPGVTVTLTRTTQQDDQAIVELDAASDFSIQANWMHVNGDGPDWRSSVRTSQGGASWSLAWVGGELPDPIPLRVIGTAWLEGAGPVDVSIGGVR